MNDASKEEHEIQIPEPVPLHFNRGQGPTITNPMPAGAANSPSGDAGIPPSPARTSPALGARAAWRQLCARTGCSITLRCFYKWIWKGRIDSVRMGNKIYIEAEVLDRLVDDALHGDGW